MSQTKSLAFQSLTSVSFVPSGDHEGAAIRAGASNSTDGYPLIAATTEMLGLAVLDDTYAILAPSGDHAGVRV